MVVSVVMLLAIGFVATPPPNRVPLFEVNALLVIPVIILGSRWQRVFGCILLAVVLLLAEQEYSAGKKKNERESVMRQFGRLITEHTQIGNRLLPIKAQYLNVLGIVAPVDAPPALIILKLFYFR